MALNKNRNKQNNFCISSHFTTLFFYGKRSLQNCVVTLVASAQWPARPIPQRCFVQLSKLVFLALLLSFSACGYWARTGSSRVSEYFVRPGDTLYEIAMQHGVQVEHLVEVNNLDDPDRLSVGQILLIPEGFESTVNFMGFAHHSEVAESDTSDRRFMRLREARKYRGKLSSPLERGSFRVNSRFGWRGSSFHEGLDLAAEPGTTVYAAHPGEVVYAGQGMSGYGKILVIRYGPIMSVYAHNQSLDVGFGEQVEQGQKIAEVGSTGRASGPHLHFEMRIETPEGRFAAVDPLIFYP